MIDLSDVIYQGPTLTWAKAKVVSVETDGTLTVSMNNGSVPHVKILESYANPAAGDITNCLIFEPVGMIAIGPSRPLTLPTPPTPGTPIIIAKTDVGVWSQESRHWSPGFILKKLFQTAILYAQESFEPMADLAVASFQVELQSLVPGGSTPILVLHGNDSVINDSEPFLALSMEFAPNVMVPDTGPIWVDIPTSWAEAIIAGTAYGVGLKQSMYKVPEASFTAASGSLRIVLLT
jgi:hypothetical protein